MTVHGGSNAFPYHTSWHGSSQCNDLLKEDFRFLKCELLKLLRQERGLIQFMNRNHKNQLFVRRPLLFINSPSTTPVVLSGAIVIAEKQVQVNRNNAQQVVKFL